MNLLTLSKHHQTIQARCIQPINISSVNMNLVSSIVLGGGRGSRLYPLTHNRCKPAINFGGHYCLVDIPISHSIHAGVHTIFVLTQFLSYPLHRHILQTYNNVNTRTNIEILTAEQKPDSSSWFEGTADAVRHNIDVLTSCPVEYFLILSGDQLYNIDFKTMVAFSANIDVDVVIATLPIQEEDAKRMGVLKINESHIITDFHEKPDSQALLKKFNSQHWFTSNPQKDISSQKTHLGSMGIYLFKKQALINILKATQSIDFGKHLIPKIVDTGRAAAFIYDGYWEDIGTIQSFYHANLDLTQKNPKFDFYHKDRPIYSYRSQLIPTKCSNTLVKNAILCEGCVIEGDEITHSIIGPKCMIHNGVIIRDSYLMGNDYYESPVIDHPNLPACPSIGENCMINRAIIDKNACLGKGVQLINKQNLTHYDSENIYVRDGIMIVPQGAILPDGFIF